MTTKRDFLEATKKAVGSKFDAAVFEKAYGRAKRWMVAAYGCADLEEYAGESGLDLSAWYDETLTSAVNKSFNRRSFAPRGC